MGREIREDEILLGTTFDAYEQDVKRMLDAPIDRHGTGEGRSKWYWLMLANGDLCMVTFPLGEMYEEMTQVRNVCMEWTKDKMAEDVEDNEKDEKMSQLVDFAEVENRVVQEIADDLETDKPKTIFNMQWWVIMHKHLRTARWDEPKFMTRNILGTSWVTVDVLDPKIDIYTDKGKESRVIPEYAKWVLLNDLDPKDYRESIGGTKTEWIVKSKLDSTSGPLFFSYENEMWFSVGTRDELDSQLTDKDIFTATDMANAAMPWGGNFVRLVHAYRAIDVWAKQHVHRRRDTVRG